MDVGNDLINIFGVGVVIVVILITGYFNFVMGRAVNSEDGSLF